ncbi:Eco57I restriction-modification methylase domain-containing protein [Winogradskyella ouciana]|uniref:Eco57I restriction-modification methylase domain-containing protein n=1 Tax=Winogradskyella ouciana TaxID=2608631 RepID=UPI003D2D3B7E
MALFQNSVLNKYLKGLESEKVNEAYKRFVNHFHNPTIQENIRNNKEEQYQGEFLIDLFVNVFGYIKNPTPDFNLTTELKNIKDSKKTDGAILKGEKALAVIELKGTNTTDLSKVETQAFGYKNNQPGCNYVITSNFEKLRFYIDNAVDFEEFNLFQLTKERFDVLWLCLSSDYLLKDIPKKIKDESLTQEENVTKKLYKDYAAFRNEIFDAIQKENPEYDKLTLFKKTQKLLDRFLFIFFAEDRLLLPPNYIRSIVNDWKDLRDKYDAYTPLYDRFKKYFGYMNIGHKGHKHDIFAYNGGLFAPDAILDNININDELLHRHTLNLSNYDFESEVSVNILGHIFEHSLNDIDEIQAEIQGIETEQSKTKRKKDGVFYTPKYITKYIVDNTVGKLCEEKKIELDITDENYQPAKQRSRKRLKALQTYRDWLLQLTICDPACGSGAFLNQALEFLIAEHAYIDQLSAKYNKDALVLSDVENSILENNLFGVDINEESVEIAKLSLWLRTAQKGRKLTALNNNIKCGNSLIDDPAVAGDKAFNWQNEFPEVFAEGGFDVLIGNPPYVRVQFLPYNEIDFYKANKETAHKRVDISTLFFEQSYELLKDNGHLCFITSNQFQTTEYGLETRRFISNKFQILKILDFGDLPVFEGALTYVSIYSMRKSTPNDFLYKRVNSISEAQIGNYIGFIEISVDDLNEKKWALVSKVELELLKKLEGFEELGNYGNAWAGLFTGLDEIMMFDEVEMNNSGIEKDLFLPIIRAGDPIRNGLAVPSKYVIYPYKEDNGKTVVFTEDELLNQFPSGYKYLLEHKEKLQARKDSRKTFKNREDWYALTRFGRKNIFNKSKIVSPGEVKEHRFSLDKTGSGFSCARVFAITVNTEISIYSLLSILNSKLIKFFLQRKSSLKAGGYYSYSSKVLNSVPIPDLMDKKLDLIIESSININQILNELDKTFINLLLSKYRISKLTKKLQNWHELDFGEFLKELEKARKKSAKENETEYNKLSLSEEAEWMPYFNEQKQKAEALKAETDKTDREIDQMVYELYGLTDDEIKIVEEATK